MTRWPMASVAFLLLLPSMVAAEGGQVVWDRDVCDRLKGHAEQFAVPNAVAEFRYSDFALLEYEVYTEGDGYPVALVGLTAENVMGNRLEDDNEIYGPATGVAENLGLPAPPIYTKWDEIVFVATNRERVADVDCAANVSLDDRLLLVFTTFGVQISPPESEVLEVVLDEEDEFFYILYRDAGSEFTNGWLAQRRGQELHSVSLIGTSHEAVRNTLGKTAMLNLGVIN